MESSQNFEVSRESLNIDLIVQSVFETLDFHTLKNCRLVNKKWKILASKWILKEDLAIVKFNFFETVVEFVKITQDEQFRLSNNMDSKLSWFNSNILKNSDNFPCANFRFCGGDLGQPEIQKLLNVQGQKIKTIYIVGDDRKPDDCLTSQLVFYDLLQHQLPNLEDLTIGPFSYEWPQLQDQLQNDDDHSHLTLMLPHLKKFSWKGHHFCNPNQINQKPIVQVIMNASPNLKLIRDFDLQTDVEIVPFELKRAIKKFTIKLEFLRPLLGHLQTFFEGLRLEPNESQVELRLEELTFENVQCRPYPEYFFREEPLTFKEQQKLLQFLQKLFQYSRDSLKTLKLFSLFSDIPNLELPPLPNLRKLQIGHICTRGSHTRKVFPKGINLTKTFPNLKYLDCTHLIWEDGFSRPRPPNLNEDGRNFETLQFPTVETIQLGELCTEFWMKNLRELCPNFRKLVVKNSAPTNSIRQLDWRTFTTAFEQSLGGVSDPNVRFGQLLINIFRSWDFLQELEVIVELSKASRNEQFLDSVFTGIPGNYCKILLKEISQGHGIGRGSVEDLRIKPSINSLTGLRKLRIGFSRSFQDYFGEKFDIENKDKIPNLLYLSWLYSFKLMPELVVTVIFDHGNRRTTPG